MSEANHPTTQEPPDAWGLRALGRPVPPTNGANASNPGPQTGGNGGNGSGPESPSSQQQAQNRGDNTASGEQGQTNGTDPLEGITLQDLLKHSRLGSELTSWNDRTTNSRLETERPNIERELRPRVQAEVEDQDYVSHLETLSPEERGREFDSNPRAVGLWQAHLDAKAAPDLQQQALAAQVYAAATLIRGVRSMIAQTDLPDTEKTALSDVTKFQEKGMPGVEEWVAQAVSRITEFQAESKHKSEIDKRWESERESNAGRISTSNPRPGISGPGSIQEPRPDIFEGHSRDFLAAFRS